MNNVVIITKEEEEHKNFLFAHQFQKLEFLRYNRFTFSIWVAYYNQHQYHAIVTQ
jgi:hypothetical protein